MCDAQTYQWLPTNSPLSIGRYDDVYFLNSDTGYAVTWQPYPSFIMKTINGGFNWVKVLDSVPFSFRDIGFTDAMHGFTGTLYHTGNGADTNIMYQTIDGGLTWNGASNFPGPDTAGICGLRVINDSTIYGVGRFDGPAGFYKTTNNGLTWNYTNLSSLISGLVDIFFFDADTGFVSGTTGPSFFNGYGRILYTTNAGTTWSIVHTSPHVNTIGWKLSFPSRQMGYGSLEFISQDTNQYFLKTTDGGITWQDILYIGGPSYGYDVEGIGFINDTTGWVGGDPYLYFTQNGGATWTQQTWGNAVNRFRFLSDTCAYAAGQMIYKMHLTPTGIIMEPENNMYLNSYPNPLTNKLTISTNNNELSEIILYDITSKKLLQQQFTNSISINTEQLAKGIYIYEVTNKTGVIKKGKVVKD
jgi:photosystem II stability/assembly factor-like uncharacterized protein